MCYIFQKGKKRVVVMKRPHVSRSTIQSLTFHPDTAVAAAAMAATGVMACAQPHSTPAEVELIARLGGALHATMPAGPVSVKELVDLVSLALPVKCGEQRTGVLGSLVHALAGVTVPAILTIGDCVVALLDSTTLFESHPRAAVSQFESSEDLQSYLLSFPNATPETRFALCLVEQRPPLTPSVYSQHELAIQAAARLPPGMLHVFSDGGDEYYVAGADDFEHHYRNHVVEGWVHIRQAWQPIYEGGKWYRDRTQLAETAVAEAVCPVPQLADCGDFFNSLRALSARFFVPLAFEECCFNQKYHHCNRSIKCDRCAAITCCSKSSWSFSCGPCRKPVCKSCYTIVTEQCSKCGSTFHAHCLLQQQQCKSCKICSTCASLESCHKCKVWQCKACLATCSSCKRNFCKSCRGQCQKCFNKVAGKDEQMTFCTSCRAVPHCLPCGKEWCSVCLPDHPCTADDERRNEIFNF